MDNPHAHLAKLHRAPEIIISVLHAACMQFPIRNPHAVAAKHAQIRGRAPTGSVLSMTALAMGDKKRLPNCRNARITTIGIFSPPLLCQHRQRRKTRFFG